jgi:serine/threonine protein kinase
VSRALLYRRHHSRGGRIKLTDFGLAAQLTASRDQRNTLVGTPDLLAPEVGWGLSVRRCNTRVVAIRV